MVERRNPLSILGANSNEMGKLRNSGGDELDRLLGKSGLTPDGKQDPLAKVLSDIKAEFAAQPSGSVEARHLAGIQEALRISNASGGPAIGPAASVKRPEQKASGQPSWRRTIVLSELLSTLTAKIVAGTMVAAAATGGMAAAGVLPDPAQQAIADVASHVGLSLPSPEDDAADAAKNAKSQDHNDGKPDGTDANDKGMSAEVQKLKDSGLSGCELGRAVSAAASAKGADHRTDNATENRDARKPCKSPEPKPSASPGDASEKPEGIEAPETEVKPSNLPAQAGTGEAHRDGAPDSGATGGESSDSRIPAGVSGGRGK